MSETVMPVKHGPKGMRGTLAERKDKPGKKVAMAERRRQELLTHIHKLKQAAYSLERLAESMLMLLEEDDDKKGAARRDKE